MFERHFPHFHKLGMTEEQFWKSNPRIWKVWEEAHKQKVKEMNFLMYIQGVYELRAIQVALDHGFNGKKAKSEYFDKPIQIYEFTEEEKKQNEKEALAKIVNFFNSMEHDAKKKETKQSARKID